MSEQRACSSCGKREVLTYCHECYWRMVKRGDADVTAAAVFEAVDAELRGLVSEYRGIVPQGTAAMGRARRDMAAMAKRKFGIDYEVES